MNKKTTPKAAVPMGRWRSLAARCLNPAGGGVTLSFRLRNALFVLFIGGILAYGGPGSPGSFRYGAFDANARTAIIVFPSEGGEVSFDVDFSSIS